MTGEPSALCSMAVPPLAVKTFPWNWVAMAPGNGALVYLQCAYMDFLIIRHEDPSGPCFCGNGQIFQAQTKQHADKCLTTSNQQPPSKAFVMAFNETDLER